MISGLRQISLPVDSYCTVEDLISKLIKQYPEFCELLPDEWRNEPDLYLIVLKKGKILLSDSILEDSDEITIVTPMSGG